MDLLEMLIFFKWQEENMQVLMERDPIALTSAIKRSCESKSEIVSLDEKESGLRATLNLGHTFGHAIETGVGYGQWLHGEVVAAGTVMAVDMSYRLCWIDDSIVKRVDNILKRAKLPTAPPETMTVDIFKSVMAVDKKVADGLLRLILLQGPLGNCYSLGIMIERRLMIPSMHFASPYFLPSFCNSCTIVDLSVDLMVSPCFCFFFFNKRETLLTQETTVMKYDWEEKTSRTKARKRKKSYRKTKNSGQRIT